MAARLEAFLPAAPLPARPAETIDAEVQALAQAEAIIRLRRQRDQLFEAGLFGDPAWDILLDLFVAQLSGRRISVTSACAAAAVPPTTALRWLGVLVDWGLVLRNRDGRDGRRVYVELVPETFQRLLTLLSRDPRFASRGSPNASSISASPRSR